MLNIVSRSALSSRVGGQTKVFHNLVAGLAKLGYPYVINRRLDSCEMLWIHDDTRALPLIHRLPIEVKVVVGPNLYVMPRDIPADIKLDRAVYVHPSQWAVDVWSASLFDRAKLRVWPVGIDTEMFKPVDTERKSLVMVYHKHRSIAELEALNTALRERGIESITMRYGSYSQDDYRRALSQSKFVVWHGCQESQGIALQEAMACGVPILVWDVRELKDFSAGVPGRYQFTEAEGSFPVTSAPFFDARCGLRAMTFEEVLEAVGTMELRWPEFAPRDFIVQNLSLEGQAAALLKIFEDVWPGSSQPRARVVRDGPWRPPMSWIAYAALRRLHDLASTLLLHARQLKA